jgi:CRP-like cAMP-binding protein
MQGVNTTIAVCGRGPIADAAAAALQELNAFLLGIPLFASLDEITRLELAEHLEPVQVAAGEVVIRQGDPGDSLFLLVSGRLRVSVAADGTERVLHDLGRGAIVGEIALLSKRPRSATVRAIRDSDLLVLRASSFDALVERHPALLAELARLLADRLLIRDQMVAAERPQVAPPAGRTITVAAAGQPPSGPGARRASWLCVHRGPAAAFLLRMRQPDPGRGGNHERGPLWPAVRASLSLPGVFPPVYAAGDLLSDGGALDNVPVEAMRGRIGNGCIVAVDVSPEVEPRTVTPSEAGMSGWRVLGRRLSPWAPPQSVPSVVDILSRSTGLSQVRHRRAALDRDRIDLLLRPPVAGVGTLDFKGGAALIKVGYRHAAEALAKSGLAERFVA